MEYVIIALFCALMGSTIEGDTDLKVGASICYYIVVSGVYYFFIA